MRRAGRACPAFWTTQRADDLAAIAERLRLATEDTNAPATNRQPERTENVEVSFYQEPQVGIEPTTARLRIECSTTELLWRDPARAMDRRVTRMPWLGFEPRRLSAPPPQDGVSTSFTTRARISSIVSGVDGLMPIPRTANNLSCEPILPTGATGLEPATSRVTVECSNQTELLSPRKTRCAVGEARRTLIFYRIRRGCQRRFTWRPPPGPPRGGRWELGMGCN